MQEEVFEHTVVTVVESSGPNIYVGPGVSLWR